MIFRARARVAGNKCTKGFRVKMKWKGKHRGTHFNWMRFAREKRLSVWLCLFPKPDRLRFMQLSRRAVTGAWGKTGHRLHTCGNYVWKKTTYGCAHIVMCSYAGIQSTRGWLCRVLLSKLPPVWAERDCDHYRQKTKKQTTTTPWSPGIHKPETHRESCSSPGRAFLVTSYVAKQSNGKGRALRNHGWGRTPKRISWWTLPILQVKQPDRGVSELPG